MNNDEARKHLKPGVLIQYTPHSAPHEKWFNGVVVSVSLKDMDPAYAVETGRSVELGSVVKAASVGSIRLREVLP